MIRLTGTWRMNGHDHSLDVELKSVPGRSAPYIALKYLVDEGLAWFLVEAVTISHAGVADTALR